MSKLRYLRDWRRLPARVVTLCKAWQGQPHGPRTIQIEHTKRCNLKCVMCTHGTACPPAKEPDMTLDEFKTCLDGAHALGNLDTVHIQGLGEPFLHKDFPAMVRHAKQLGLRTHAITNMTVMGEDLAEDLIRSGHDYLAVSLDSPDPAFVAALRRGVSFDVLERVVENIRLIRRKQAELKRDNPEIVVYAIAMKDTIPQLGRMKALLKGLGIRTLCFQELCTDGVGPDALMPNGTRVMDEPLDTLSPEELKRAITAMTDLSDPDFTVVPSHIFDDYAGAGHHQDGIYTCLDVWERPAIAVDGTVTPCCYTVGSRLLDMGNMKQKSFQDIWRDAPFAALRRAHLLGSPPPVCRVCPQLFQFLTPWRVWKNLDHTHPHRYDAVYLRASRP